ncbi:MAG: hypothetical protein FJX46_10550 [Alphaproteobacteria bacterium]|nr:hypothetical protein [Alphaproteobacteria bacterium]
MQWAQRLAGGAIPAVIALGLAGPAPAQNAVTVEEFVVDAGRAFDGKKVTIEGTLENRGTYWQLFSIKRPNAPSYVRLNLTSEQIEWARRNCRNSCTVRVRGTGKRAAPSGHLEAEGPLVKIDN